MRYLEYVESYMPTPGAEYSVALYPKTGIYKNMAGWIIVLKEANLVYPIGTIDPKLDEMQPSQGHGEDFLLKLIAVTQSPVLATQLIKGN